MESGKRSKNFTEREKMLLIEVAKEFVAIIDNKKTDGSSVEAKKQAWMALTSKYNAVSETGFRTEKQLHALYDNIKKKARKNMSDDKSEMYKTGGGTFCPKTTTVDEKVVALLTPQFQPLDNEFDSSAPYYEFSIHTSTVTQGTDTQGPDTQGPDTQGPIKDPQLGTIQDIELEANEDSEKVDSPINCHNRKRQLSPAALPILKDVESTPKQKKMCLTETKKRNINNLSASIIKRKNQKQENEDSITKKKLEILEVQRQQEAIKLEKNNIILDLDIELKKVLLESAKIELEFKKKNYNLG